jgi:outer membrane protein with beta-barrel domain
VPGNRWTLLSLVTTTLLGRELAAQSAQAVSVQVSGLYSGVYGDVFSGVKSGYGGEGQIRYTPGALSIGAGFQYTTHDVTGQTEDIRFYGAFLEPRYRIHTGSNVVAPYVSARFSLLKVGFSGGDLELDSSFIQLNGGGGLLYRLGSRFNLDMGATFGYDRLGSGTLTRKSTGGTAPITSDSGANLVVRLGLVLGIGG